MTHKKIYPAHIFSALLFSLFFISCSPGGEIVKKEKSAKLSHSKLHEKLCRSKEDELVPFIFEVVGVNEKKHCLSVYIEDSKVTFQLTEEEAGKNLGACAPNITLLYDQYGLDKVRMGAGFQKGQLWKLFFNKNGELVDLKFLKEKKAQG